MIEEILGLDTSNIQPHHDRVIQELINYNADLIFTLQLFTEYEDVNGMCKEEFILNEQDILYTIIGTASALLFLYIKFEQFELSEDLHKEMKKAFCLIMDEIFIDTNNEQKFYELIEKMFETFRNITQ